MSKTEIEAPKKLSEAIKLALVDLRAVEKMKDVVIDMGDWHSSAYDSTYSNSKIPCAVCFAGAVMHQTHQTPTEKEVGPDDFSHDWADVFESLDMARIHFIATALQPYVNLRLSHRVNVQEIVLEGLNRCDYDSEKTKFKRNMRTIANRLAKLGY